MGESCTFCDCDVERHSPVYVAEKRAGERVEVGRFCNYGCLVAFVEEHDLLTGARCRLDDG